MGRSPLLYRCPGVVIGPLLKPSMLKRYFAFSLISLLVLSTEASSQINLPNLLKRIPSAGISESEAAQAVKEALAQGVTKAVLNLHKTDGFFGSEIYKVLLPPDSKKG
jgi:hypothetical protein